MDPRAARRGQAPHQRALCVEVRDRAAGGDARAADLLAARQGAGRLERAERHGLRLGRPGGVRPLARWAAGWGFRDVLPVLPAAGELPVQRRPGRGHGGPVRITDRKRARPRRALGRLRRAPASRPASRRRPTTTRRATKACATSSRPRTTAGAEHRGRLPARGARGVRTCRSRRDALVARVLFEGTKAAGVEYRAGRRRAHRARDARGAPLRRRDPVAAAARALGRGRRGAAAARWASRWSRTGRRWART